MTGGAAPDWHERFELFTKVNKQKGIYLHYTELMQKGIWRVHMNKTPGSTALSQSFFVEILDLTPDALLLIDLNTRLIVYANKACIKYYGYDQEEFLGMPVENLTMSDKDKIAREMQKTIKKYPESYRYYAMHVRKNGHHFPVEVITRMIVIDERRYFLSHITDITRNNELKERIDNLIKRLSNKAYRDYLTGAYNRAYLYEVYLPRVIGYQVGLLILDIDYFKNINDRYGHEGGDTILQAVVRIALACIRKRDKIIRYGGDEFVIILPGADISETKGVAERIKSAVISTAVLVGREKVSCSITIGMAWGYLAETGDLDKLIKKADHELLNAKNARFKK